MKENTLISSSQKVYKNYKFISEFGVICSFGYLSIWFLPFTQPRNYIIVKYLNFVFP